jgi:uncharacterized damage-inducible protein DinB
MLFTAVAAILDRDLRALRREVEAYPDEAQLWEHPAGISNAAGTLALHLAGNLRHYFGAVLGGTGYVRDRPAEFARRGVSRASLLDEIEAAREAIRAAAPRVTDAMLASDFPEPVGGARVQAGEYLVHLVAHFAYHLGQIDYHRRVVTGQSGGLEVVRAAELGSARAVST